MSFEWLNKFLKDSEKSPDYAEKTLAAYKLGLKGKGSIAGVQILADPEGCEACQTLKPETIYQPDDAPLIPLAECDRRSRCRCVYRPVMSYQIEGPPPEKP